MNLLAAAMGSTALGMTIGLSVVVGAGWLFFKAWDKIDEIIEKNIGKWSDGALTVVKIAMFLTAVGLALYTMPAFTTVAHFLSKPLQAITYHVLSATDPFAKVAIFFGVGTSYYQSLSALKDYALNAWKTGDWIYKGDKLDQIAAEYFALTGKEAKLGLHYSTIFKAFNFSTAASALGAFLLHEKWFIPTYNPAFFTFLGVGAIATAFLRFMAPAWNGERSTIESILNESLKNVKKEVDDRFELIQPNDKNKIEKADEKLAKLKEVITNKLAALEQFKSKDNSHRHDKHNDNEFSKNDKLIENVLIVKAINDSGLPKTEKLILYSLLKDPQQAGVNYANLDDGKKGELFEAGQNVKEIAKILYGDNFKAKPINGRIEELEKGSVLRAQVYKRLIFHKIRDKARITNANNKNNQSTLVYN